MPPARRIDAFACKQLAVIRHPHSGVQSQAAHLFQLQRLPLGRRKPLAALDGGLGALQVARAPIRPRRQLFSDSSPSCRVGGNRR